MKRTVVGTIAAAAVAVVCVASPAATAGTSASGGGCSTPLPKGGESVDLDPADFGGPIDNVYWPMAPGTRWVYREADRRGHAQKVVVVVTARSKAILGIDATVVHDVVSKRGQLVENTFDWYAQDGCGNVWYLGERTKEYEGGQVVSTEGSWQAGVDGAQAGVAMPADPQVGLTYRQEYYEGQAEDAAAVLSLDERAEAPYGFFRRTLLTKDFTTLHPRILEYKMYAKGVGPVLEMGVSGGSDRTELVGFHTA